MKNPTLIWALSAGVGMVAWFFIANGMNRAGTFAQEPNFLHLKGSPYGRTIAYAMRGPADLYWHRGQIEEQGEIEERDHTLGMDPHEGEASFASSINEMKRLHEEEEAEHHAEKENQPPPEFDSLRQRLLHSIKEMRMTYFTRTNPKGDTPLMEAWRFGEAEKLLKLSYEMDPTNLLCYGSYYLFVSESIARLKGDDVEQDRIQMGEQRALELSIATLQACHKFPEEPTAAITAASASNDAATLLHRSKIAKPGAYAAMHDHFRHSLEWYVNARDRMIAEGTWMNYSIYRREEMESVFGILRASYFAAEKSAENAAN